MEFGGRWTAALAGQTPKKIPPDLRPAQQERKPLPMIKHSNGASRQAIARKLTTAPTTSGPRAGDGFVVTPEVEELIGRRLRLSRCGYPINLSGPAGTGKTTLALHLAAKFGRPVMLIHGDDEFGSFRLVGNDIGYRKKSPHRPVRPFGGEGKRRRCVRCGSTTA